MTYDILATGSSGNAVVINSEILIDCGVPMKRLRESGFIKKLKLVLLTHRHTDHFNAATVRTLHRERPSLRWGCCEWMVPHLLEAGVNSLMIDIYRSAEELPDFFGPWYDYDYFVHVRPEILTHNILNCGYHIADWFSEEILFYATDTSTLDGIEAKGYDLYLIEANHTQAEIEARIAEKQARGEFAYEYRAAQNHLSREQALAWLSRNAGPDSRYVFLHQHKEASHD